MSRTGPGVPASVGHLTNRQIMTAIGEDTGLIHRALTYAIELYRELTDENGAPTPSTQNQIADFILADPKLREAIAQWGRPLRSTTRRPGHHGAFLMMPPICESGTLLYHLRINRYLCGLGKSPAIVAVFRRPPRYIGRKHC